MRFVVCVLAAVNLFVVGPLLVGIPLLAHVRMDSGAAAFGLLMGAFAIGNLGGVVIAGTTRPPTSSLMRVIILGFLGANGAVVMSFSAISNVGIAGLLLAVIGTGNGYLAIVLFTWVQGRTPPRLLGRTVSVVTFAGIGLVSVSQAGAGMLARWDLDALFLISGLLVLGTTAWAATRPGLFAFAAGVTETPSNPTTNQTTNRATNPEREPTP